MQAASDGKGQEERGPIPLHPSPRSLQLPGHWSWGRVAWAPRNCGQGPGWAQAFPPHLSCSCCFGRARPVGRDRKRKWLDAQLQPSLSAGPCSSPKNPHPTPREGRQVAPGQLRQASRAQPRSQGCGKYSSGPCDPHPYLQKLLEWRGPLGGDLSALSWQAAGVWAAR